MVLKGLVDPGHEMARIDRELKKVERDLAALEIVSSPGFAERAPKELVEAHAQRGSPGGARARPGGASSSTNSDRPGPEATKAISVSRPYRLCPPPKLGHDRDPDPPAGRLRSAYRGAQFRIPARLTLTLGGSIWSPSTSAARGPAGGGGEAIPVVLWGSAVVCFVSSFILYVTDPPTPPSRAKGRQE